MAVALRRCQLAPNDLAVSRKSRSPIESTVEIDRHIDRCNERDKESDEESKESVGAHGECVDLSHVQCYRAFIGRHDRASSPKVRSLRHSRNVRASQQP